MIHPSLASLAIPITSLTQDPANARKHPGRNLEVIKASLRDFGKRKPIVVRREGMAVEAGNGTLQAAIELGWKEIAAVVVDDDSLTATRFGIVDNRSAELAEWDDDNLEQLLSALIDNGVVVDDLGFNAEEMAAIHGRSLDEDDAPPSDLNAIIRYEVIFDSVEQQDRFYSFLKRLKEDMPDHATVASRLDDFIRQHGI